MAYFLLSSGLSRAQAQNCGLGTKLTGCVGVDCPPLTLAPDANNDLIQDNNQSGYPINTTYLPLPFNWPNNQVRAYSQVFNVLVGGNFNVKDGGQGVPAEIEGRVAIKGNLILGNPSIPYNSYYGIGTSGGGTYVIASTNLPALLIGGTITGSTNMFGVGGTGVAMGGTYQSNLPNSITVTDSLGMGGIGLNIDSCLIDISTKSLYWATLTPTGTLSGDTLIGDNSSSVQVFNVSSWKNFVFKNIPSGASVVVNVSGSTHTNVQMPLVNAVTPAAGSPSLFRLLFNFHQATNVTFIGTFYGSAIIPNGNATLSGGNFDGRLVVGGNLTHEASGGEVHNYPFVGEFPCPPACLKTSFTFTAPACAPDKKSYSVTFNVTQKNGTIKVNAGTLTGSGNGPYTVSNIPPTISLKITDSLTSICKFDTTILAPAACNCTPAAPVAISPNVFACAGDTIPTLKVNVLSGVTADWYANATGGSAIATGVLSYKPAGTASVTDTFYVEARGTTQNCGGISVLRTPIIVTVQDCDSLIDLKLKKSISKKLVQIGDTLQYTIKVWNENTSFATGVEVIDSLSAGVQYLSSSTKRLSNNTTAGSYDPLTSKWTIGAIGINGDTVALTIKVKVVAQGVWFNTAEISKANEKDVDSTPFNQSESEDDLDRQCFSVPIKLCGGEKALLTIPGQFTGVQWFKTGSNTAIAQGNQVLLEESGTYTYTSSSGTCPAEGCCPIIIEASANCCIVMCVPYTAKKIKK
ncbi:choice-of-anchor A family protein [Runella salmonicolor]|uniref:Choice-of-anchor A family protein n=1 Tax=Runella salmonicolor TaxID=2950278 RepID=A0ABT1FMN6_9BACT|nr:choice-of-anchor A family protein [Runella salmonicolor]MCP1383009.1 choice-of-anchor A family protein [Runella salmonicolor]